MSQALNAAGELIDLPPVDPALKAERTASAEKRRSLRDAQRIAAAERASVRDMAIDLVIAGQPIPAELTAYHDDLKTVLDATITDPLPTLPEKPVVEAVVK